MKNLRKKGVTSVTELSVGTVFLIVIVTIVAAYIIYRIAKYTSTFG